VKAWFNFAAKLEASANRVVFYPPELCRVIHLPLEIEKFHKITLAHST
jgi:hypothetical protein